MPLFLFLFLGGKGGGNSESATEESSDFKFQHFRILGIIRKVDRKNRRSQIQIFYDVLWETSPWGQRDKKIKLLTHSYKKLPKIEKSNVTNRNPIGANLTEIQDD